MGAELRGRELRYLLTTLLRSAQRPLTVGELVAGCEAEGVVFSGRASKVVSDALRWEVGWGRVRRLSRGVYCYGEAPRSTVHWIARRVAIVRAHLARARAGERLVLPWPTRWATSMPPVGAVESVPPVSLGPPAALVPVPRLE